MSYLIHSDSNEQLVLELNPAGSGYSSASAGMFNLRRRIYFIEAGVNCAMDTRLTKPGLTEAGCAAGLHSPPAG